jgi:hypothetical protein
VNDIKHAWLMVSFYVCRTRIRMLTNTLLIFVDTRLEASVPNLAVVLSFRIYITIQSVSFNILFDLR